MTYEEYKKELTIALNNIASSGAINYALYKALYEFINGNKTVIVIFFSLVAYLAFLAVCDWDDE